jgi:hypothetical protein
MVRRLPAIVNAAVLTGSFPSHLGRKGAAKQSVRSGGGNRRRREALAGEQEGSALGFARIAKQLPLHGVETV